MSGNKETGCFAGGLLPKPELSLLLTSLTSPLLSLLKTRMETLMINLLSIGLTLDSVFATPIIVPPQRFTGSIPVIQAR